MGFSLNMKINKLENLKNCFVVIVENPKISEPYLNTCGTYSLETEIEKATVKNCVSLCEELRAKGNSGRLWIAELEVIKTYSDYYLENNSMLNHWVAVHHVSHFQDGEVEVLLLEKEFNDNSRISLNEFKSRSFFQANEAPEFQPKFLRLERVEEYK